MDNNKLCFYILFEYIALEKLIELEGSRLLRKQTLDF